MKIGEVSKLTNMSADTLRYYEKEGLIGPIRKVNAIRDYSQQDIDRVLFIQHMKRAGMRVTTLKEYLDMVDEGNSTTSDRLEILNAHKDSLEKEIDEMKRVYDILSRKIENYEDHLRVSEDKLRSENGR